jgi:UDP-glucose 4-epimerase
MVVTGGAGFIGSHVSDELLKNGHEVVVIDNLSCGSRENVTEPAKLIQKDITKDELNADFKDIDAVFHFAADPDVRSSAENPRSSFDNNVIGTFRVLEACRKNDIRRFVFASTSTVYGEVNTIPTPEAHPCEPISNYGASKLACEAYVSSYSHSYGIKSTVLRYANIFGTRSTHGVMFDFFQKLKKNPKELEILGNGRQEKSYLFISDCISATMAAFGKQQKMFDVYNVGSREKHAVDDIAKIVSKTLNSKPKTIHTGGERGWKGDVRTMLLDVSKLESLGWKESISLEKGTQIYLEWLMKNP